MGVGFGVGAGGRGGLMGVRGLGVVVKKRSVRDHVMLGMSLHGFFFAS